MNPSHNIHPYYTKPGRMDFRIGIIGSGFIVNDCHLVSYRKEGFNPVAIASRNFDAATAVAQRHEIPVVHPTVDALLEDKSIEILDIAVPPAAQADIIRKACRAGSVRGILAQKPLGVDYTEALSLVEDCDKAGIVLAVNQNGRYDPSIRAMKMALDQKLLGDPVLATIDMRGVPHWMPWQADLGWVTLRIMSIHHMDAFRFWFGDPERIYCSVRTDPRTSFPHRDGICTYILEYASGLRCIAVDDTWTGPAREGGPADIRIQWRIEGLKGTAMGDIGWCKDPYTTPSTMKLGCIGDKNFTNYQWDRSWFPDAFGGTLAQLLVAVESNTEPEISGRDNLRTMALVEAAYRSFESHRAIALSEIIG